MNGSEAKAGKGGIWFYNKAMAVCQGPAGKYHGGCPVQIDGLTHCQGAAGKMGVSRADHFRVVAVASEQDETGIIRKKAKDVFLMSGYPPCWKGRVLLQRAENG